MIMRPGMVILAGVVLTGAAMVPSSAEAQRRGVATGILAGAVVGAIVAGAATQATAKPKPQKQPRAASKPRQRTGT